MVRSCARPSCNAPAVVTFTFDGLQRILWLSPLAEAAAYSAGDLCLHHANTMGVPLRWEVRDLRTPVDGSASEPTGAAAPSRHVAPGGQPPQPLPLEDEPAAASSEPPERTGERRKHPVPAIPRAHTPLLERAFRAADVG